MKSAAFATALLFSCAALAAADLAAFPDGRPRDFPDLKAPVRVVNFWGSYCKPCVKEMPEMSAWFKKQKKGSVDLVGIAVDRKENIAAFLKQTPVSYPVWLYTGQDSRSFMKAHGNTVGALPFTTVEAVKCGKREAILGGVDAKKLDEAVKKVSAACK
ncbi:AhpC/TSA family antioxidant [Neisseria bacilliformis ATCC BAA-1200]|uniref:AhpC/TSA family antioxidant n=1 Tax=Neisseria bacilliformis ATCC BAA-1200 TaxID=888742 RepID=F2B943_9NEIS|nr:TlpA disulfide reductase family protein [Neisseria bacilliformis]EGF12082.1 AhpC/TSA family antioxidant [Neisseria bacilliformis ATCC BAA-1200]QMT47593.1 TlpA family protein disulfide reductase [Neisseria bacilliformis]